MSDQKSTTTEQDFVDMPKIEVTQNGEPQPEQPQGPHGAQIVNVTSDHKYTINEEELRLVLLRDDIKDLPVAVVSVAGVYRAGKSFLLNFFLRYLKASEKDRADGSWVGDDSEPLTGFSWRGGSTGNTSGILMWSEPVVVTLTSGEKVAVILLDTQGTFDTSSTIRDCSVVFALSILLSSVQVYNLMNNISENDLQYLTYFTDYGRAASGTNGKPFQVLEFLIRDWVYPYEHVYGEAGGEELLHDKLQVEPNQAKELRELREHIASIFDKIKCFLMPHPGFGILNPNFKGEMRAISPDFREYLKMLVSSLFSPDKLLIKTINGHIVKSRDLYEYFVEYMKIFNSGQLPPADTIRQATAKAGLLAASNEARQIYIQGMDRELAQDKPGLPTDSVKDLHKKYFDEAKATFNSRKQMASSTLAEEYLNEITGEISKRLPQYLAANLSKLQKAATDAEAAYARSIASVRAGKPLCLHPLDVAKVHQNAVNAAVETFDASRLKIEGKRDDERTAFIRGFESKLTQLELDNQRNNKTELTDVRLKYFEFMQSQCFIEPPLSSRLFKQQHEASLEKAIKDFMSRRNIDSSYPQDEFKFQLIKTISDTYTQLKQMNKSKNKVAITGALQAYTTYMDMVWHHEQSLHPDVLRDENERAMCRALQEFAPARACDKGFDLTDEDQRTLHEFLMIRYRELVSINESANDEAVEYAYEVFKSYILERVKFSWWWLLIIPLFQTAFSVNKYISEAKEAALTAFKTKRRPGGLTQNDPYRSRLVERMEQVERREKPL